MISLKFFYDGEDLTGADSRLTQETMEGHLCCNLLTRVVFHTQTDIAGLLEVPFNIQLWEANLLYEQRFVLAWTYFRCFMYKLSNYGCSEGEFFPLFKCICVFIWSLLSQVWHLMQIKYVLLQANDKEFKAELSRIAEMTIWDTAKEEASEQLKHANKCQVQLEQQLLVRSEYIADLRNKVLSPS